MIHSVQYRDGFSVPEGGVLRIVGVGVDVVEIRRFHDILARRPERIAVRLFTPEERAEFRQDPARMAGCFAAKEAVLKALGSGLALGVSWQHVVVAHALSGAPTVELSGRAGDLAIERGISKVHLSISHGIDSAIAFAVAEGN